MVYVSQVIRESGTVYLSGVDDQDWDEIKHILRELASEDDGLDNGNIDYTPHFDSDGIEIL